MMLSSLLFSLAPLVRLALLVSLALGAAACGASAIPEHDVWIRVTAGVEEVEIGRPFPLTVERIYLKDLVPEVWRDEALAPLAVRLVETLRTEDGRRVRENRKYVALVASLKDVSVPGPSFSAMPPEGGKARTAVAEPIEIRVKRALDPLAPGEVELPGGLLTRAPPSGLAVGAGTVLLFGAAVLIWARRRSNAARRFAPPPPDPGIPPPTAAEIALGRLGDLRAREIPGPEAIRRFFDEGSGVLREYVYARFSARTLERTTEEILGERPAPAPSGDDLRLALESSDLVKFARELPGAAGRETFLAAAERFVRLTGAPAAGRAPGGDAA